MSAPEPIVEDRHGRILAELAGLTLELARDLQARALAAETAEEATKLATAFQRTARGLRQTLALELKVARYRDELARDQAKAAEQAAAAERLHAETRAKAVQRRREAIRDRAADAIWTEAEAPEAADFESAEDRERLAQDLEVWLDGAVLRPDFLTADFDLQVIEALEAIGGDPNRIYEIHDRHDAAAAETAPDPAPTDSS